MTIYSADIHHCSARIHDCSVARHASNIQARWRSLHATAHPMQMPAPVRLAFEMSVLARELTLAGLRRAHPEWSPGQLRRELLRLCFLPDELPRALR